VLFVSIYVDGILIIGSDTSALKACIQDLNTHFALKTLGSVSYFLGFEAHHNTNVLYLTQTKYTIDLLKKTAMLDCKPCENPINTTDSLTDEGDSFSNPSLYHIVIGSLQYLTYTRPDIAFIVNRLN